MNSTTLLKQAFFGNNFSLNKGVATRVKKRNPAAEARKYQMRMRKLSTLDQNSEEYKALASRLGVFGAV